MNFYGWSLEIDSLWHPHFDSTSLLPGAGAAYASNWFRFRFRHWKTHVRQQKVAMKPPALARRTSRSEFLPRFSFWVVRTPAKQKCIRVRGLKCVTFGWNLVEAMIRIRNISIIETNGRKKRNKVSRKCVVEMCKDFHRRVFT